MRRWWRGKARLFSSLFFPFFLSRRRFFFAGSARPPGAWGRRVGPRSAVVLSRPVISFCDLVRRRRAPRKTDDAVSHFEPRVKTATLCPLPNPASHHHRTSSALLHSGTRRSISLARVSLRVFQFGFRYLVLFLLLLSVHPPPLVSRNIPANECRDPNRPARNWFGPRHRL